MKKLNRDELIRLVEHITNASGCITDVDSLLNQFDANVPMPNASQLIFDPPNGRKMTAEEIVDLALENGN
jgi:hypothetical protein